MGRVPLVPVDSVARARHVSRGVGLRSEPAEEEKATDRFQGG